MNRSAGRDPFDLASDNRSQMITTFGGADNARSEKAGSGPYPGPLPEGEGTDGSEHAIAVKGLEHPHRDPFDRLIVATAMTEPMKRLTADLWELACQRWRWIRHT